jgi:cellulose synthase/poly-beta-1,6-N-acetylglucosamine synthase-like glycosyltransferase
MALRDDILGPLVRTVRRSAPPWLHHILKRAYYGARTLLLWPPLLWQRYVDPGFAGRLAHWRDAGGRPEVSIVVITYNRLGMLRECMMSLLEMTSGVDYEVVVWDNASTDGSGEFLEELVASHPTLRVHHSPVNIGLNAVSEGVKLARGFYIFECDDDVIAFPEQWLPRMLAAFKRVPRAGYLATNVVQDEKTNGARAIRPDIPTHDYGDGIVIEEGDVGGWCAMTSLEVLAKVGNFRTERGRVFILEDGDFGGRCIAAGLNIGVVRDVVVYHACGPVLNQEYGCLETCLEKYSDSPEFAGWLENAQQVAADRKNEP